MRSGPITITVLAALAMTMTASLARAQGFGYMFAGPMAVNDIGDRTTARTVGGGGEAWIGTNISVGGEVGYLYFPPTKIIGVGYSGSMPAWEGLMLSVNGSRHFRHRDNRSGWLPFVTGGISFLLGGEPVGLFNAGGGVDRWMTDHAGLRLEVRDQFLLTSYEVATVLLGFRAGFVFR
jgi:hypothetical protein